ncbi:MAG: MBOAT family O-acyltransferase, partial [Lachnospiraceae bacterium]
MVFSSFTFLFAFLPAVLLLYFICPKKFRNFILLAFSLLFYAWGEPIYVCIMLFSTVFDYVNGLLIGKFRENENEKAAKAVLIASVVINLGILCFFKYTDFFITNVNTLTGSGLNLLGIALPIGISFYTFQTLSYTIDVYRGNVEVQHNIINFGTYVTLFPQLIAGPIVQYKTVEEDLNNRRISIPEISKGIQRFLIGLGKKVLIANQVGAIWEQVHKMVPQEMSVLTAWVGILAFTFQIYFDFSGYSDMAIGLGHVFGFRFLENFEHPYESRSITEFWRRWHISLGAWFREYLYIPLGGNRVSVPRHILNLFIVWFLTGFWHGSSWNFVA